MSKKTKKSLDLSFKIERSNKLNQLNPYGLSLTEVRFLAIYQAKINARNSNTRTVIFSLAEFCKIMDIKQLVVTYIKKVADSLICKPVHLPCEDGSNGFTVIPLFNECEVKQDKETGEWFVKIECHQKVMSYMFEMKKNYFTYELWNALKLKSVNQIRMYEILKQYEKVGERVESIENLKLMLGISKNQYVRYQDFRIKVLEPCQKALEQHTDIKYAFEPIRKSRKIYALKFTITKNKDFKDDLRLKEFIKPKDLEDIQIESLIQSLYYRCKEEYTINQLEELYDYISNSGVNIVSGIDNYVYSVYANIKISKNKVNNLFRYTFSIIKTELEKHMFDNTTTSNGYNDTSTQKYGETCIESFDINEVISNYRNDILLQLKEEENQLAKKSDEPNIENAQIERNLIEVEQKTTEPTETINNQIVTNDKVSASDSSVLEFNFFYDNIEKSFVSFESCCRLQALLEKKYHKDNTYWLFEEPFTQKQVIDLILERHQIVVVPKPQEEDDDTSDFEEIINSGYELL